MIGKVYSVGFYFQSMLYIWVYEKNVQAYSINKPIHNEYWKFLLIFHAFLHFISCSIFSWFL